MPDPDQNSRSLVAIVTGAGSGIGRVVAEELVLAGHTVYAGVRDIEGRNRDRAESLREFGRRHEAFLFPLELDVLSEPGCRSAVDNVLARHGRIDLLVNNAGMLMTGIAEGFTPDQFLRILDTNAVSWLRVNRAVLPVMRRQGSGTLAYISSTTVHLAEPFMATYIASKAAAEALAEVFAFEVGQFGIDTVIVVPGAFTHGTEHFTHSSGPNDTGVVDQYGSLRSRADDIPDRLAEIDTAYGGGSADIRSVGTALVDVLRKPPGRRPRRVVVDGQHKGVEELDAVRQARQQQFFTQLGIADLLQVAVPTTPNEEK